MPFLRRQSSMLGRVGGQQRKKSRVHREFGSRKSGKRTHKERERETTFRAVHSEQQLCVIGRRVMIAQPITCVTWHDWRKKKKKIGPDFFFKRQKHRPRRIDLAMSIQRQFVFFPQVQLHLCKSLLPPAKSRTVPFALSGKAVALLSSTVSSPLLPPSSLPHSVTTEHYYAKNPKGLQMLPISLFI